MRGPEYLRMGVTSDGAPGSGLLAHLINVCLRLPQKDTRTCYVTPDVPVRESPTPMRRATTPRHITGVRLETKFGLEVRCLSSAD